MTYYMFNVHFENDFFFIMHIFYFLFSKNLFIDFFRKFLQQLFCSKILLNLFGVSYPKFQILRKQFLEISSEPKSTNQLINPDEILALLDGYGTVQIQSYCLSDVRSPTIKKFNLIYSTKALRIDWNSRSAPI